ncbi:MAG: hypothetical protein ACR2PL_01285 [Dehalococcoidia bacterium]
MQEPTQAAFQADQLSQLDESLRDIGLSCQDVLDDMEEERLGRWAAYAAFRAAGARYRSALAQLRDLQPVAELQQSASAYSAGALAGLEATSDLAKSLEYGQTESIELAIQRLSLAGQQLVRGRHLLQHYLDRNG